MPLSTELPVGDLYEFVGNFRLNGDGPPATGRVGLARLQELMLSGTSVIVGRFTSAENRIATLEGLAGIPGGSNLAQDVAIAKAGVAGIRATRYWARPGEAIDTWTASITAPPQTATPLAVGGIYSIYSDGPIRGPALRITGAGYATSIAKTHLDEGEIVEFTFRLARRIDNTGSNAAANNVPLLEFRCYKADLTDNGTVGLPATALLVADLLRPFTYRACLTPGVGTVNLPANTCFISPLFGERGNGAIELVSCDRSTQSLTSAPEMTDAIAPEDRLFIFDDSAKLIKKLTPLTLAQFVETYMAPPPTYYFSASSTFGTASTVLIAAPLDGAKIRRATVKNESQDTSQFVAVAFGGKQAVLFSPGSYTFAAGGGQTFDDLPPGAVSVVTSGAAVPVTCDLWSTANVDPNSSQRAARHLARYQGGNLNDARRKAIGDYYNFLFTSGWIDLCQGGGYIWIGRAPGNFDGLIDWANPSRTFGRAALDGSAFPDTSMAGTVFNGSNAIDSLVSPATTALARHAFLAWPDTTVQGATKNAGGLSRLQLNLNRSANSSAITSTGSTVVVSGVAPGGLQGFRRDGTNIRFYRNDALKSDLVQDVGTTFGSGTMYIGALRTPSGLVQGFTGTMELSLFAPNGLPTDAQINQLFAAHTTFAAAVGA